MKSQYLTKKKLPAKPGVYIFRDSLKRPIYIGRATSLKDRTRSYFANDLIETRGPRIVDMVTKAKFLTWQETNSVLEAIILESLLIKRYQPFYNVDERDDKSDQYVVITDELWPRVFLVRARDLEKALSDNSSDFKILKSFGPFTDSGLIKESLKILRKMFPFRDKKSYDPRHEAFYRAIGRSPQDNGDDSRKAYLKTIKYLILFFEGNTRKLRRTIKEEMDLSAQDLKFEEANKSKRLLYALDHINDIALIKKRKDLEGSLGTAFRIEAFDIAHISGTNVVGAMAVFLNGQPAKSEYRRFKIIKDKNDDIANTSEILLRRLNHSEWTYPDLIVVDGDERQLKSVEDILKARRVNLPVIAVTKNEEHKASRLIGNQMIIDKFKDNIIAVNAEAHRFAISYHRLRRSKGYGMV